MFPLIPNGFSKFLEEETASFLGESQCHDRNSLARYGLEEGDQCGEAYSYV